MNRSFRAYRVAFHASSEKGIALVLTLMITVLITAMVVEFSYGVYTTTSALHNWKESQRLSFVSKSGITLAMKTIQSDIPPNELYRFPGKMDIPVENILAGFTGTVIVSVEDENAKFNLNSLVSQNGQLNVRSYESFKLLLKILGFDDSAAKAISGRIVDWIDPDSIPSEGLTDSEEGAKNAYMDSVDELLMIKGIDRVTYETLLPYVTVYGYSGIDDARININTASIPVIMSLNERISEEQAEAVVNQRKVEPFDGVGGLTRAGIDPSLITGGQAFGSKLSPPQIFRVTSISEENKIKRVIETVVTASGLNPTVKFWREM
ncbi:MAG TPA: type II secretion system minor pseudopilin GspK [Thermodesulfovibrionales bacterium]|nr:type II secretion system minor pseudopilin GspK [Thermodesulfovibrionales bacterium]